MKEANAIKKLNANGFQPTGHKNEFKRDNNVIGFINNNPGEELLGVYVYSGENTTNSQEDYFCEHWVSNIKQAILSQGVFLYKTK